MTYNDQHLDSDLLDSEVPVNFSEMEIINEAEEGAEVKSDKKIKAHVVRRNVEDYLERKALERSLKEVFDDDFLLD